MERPKRPPLVLTALLVLAAWLFAGAGVTNCDEWTFTHDGLRLLRGDVIYRDYFQFTPPMAAWIGALGQAVLGPGVLGPRLLQEGGMVLAGLLLYGLARGLGCGPWLAIWPALVPALALHRWIPAYSHHWLVLPWLTGSLAAAHFAASAPGRRPWLAAAGALAAGATLVLQSDGLVLVLALGLWLALDAWLGEGAARERLAGAGWLAGGLGAGWGAAALWLAGHGALLACWRDCWVWPLAQYRTPGGFNDIPLATDLALHLSPAWGGLTVPFGPWFYGKVFHLAGLYAAYVGAPVAGCLWGLGLIARRARAGTRWSAVERDTSLVVLLAAGLVLATLRGRVDAIHVACYAWPSGLLAAAAAAWALRQAVPPAFALWKPLPATALAAFVATGAFGWYAQARVAPERWGQGLAPDAMLADFESVRFLRARMQPGDRLAAWHYAGYWGLYAGPVVGRWNHMTPPHVRYYAPAEYRAFWEGLVRDRPRFIVWCPQQPLSERLRQAEWLWPLPGYRRVATLPHPIYDIDGRSPAMAEIYEREPDAGTP